jgi:hypothetical protein
MACRNAGIVRIRSELDQHALCTLTASIARQNIGTAPLEENVGGVPPSRFLEQILAVCDPEEPRLCHANATVAGPFIEPCSHVTLDDPPGPCKPGFHCALGDFEGLRCFADG